MPPPGWGRVKGGTQVTSPGSERTDVFDRMTARLISADAIATVVIQESIVGVQLQSTCTAWCSEIGSLRSLDACNSGASSDRREPVSLHCTKLRKHYACHGSTE